MTLKIVRIQTDAEQYEQGSTANVHITALTESETDAGEVSVSVGDSTQAIEHRQAPEGMTLNIEGTVDLPDEPGRYDITAGEASKTVTVGEPPKPPLSATRHVDGSDVTLRVDPAGRDRTAFIERFEPPLSERPDITRRPEGDTVITVPAKKGVIVAVKGLESEDAPLGYTVVRDDEDHDITLYNDESPNENVEGETVIPARESDNRFEDMSRDELVGLLMQLLEGE